MAINVDQLNPRTAEKYRQVIEKSKYFVDIQLWPLLQKLNPVFWLENFREDELEHAIYLLDAFLYFSNDLIEAMFQSAFQGLSKSSLNLSDTSVNQQLMWSDFVDKIVITHVTKEVPHSTESGFIFERMARQVLGLPGSQFKSGDELYRLLQGTQSYNIVFVDDFVGSGEQFVHTWQRPYFFSPLHSTDFNQIAQTGQHRFFYCPIICTEFAYRRLKLDAPEVTVCPAHVMSPRYSALATDSLEPVMHFVGLFGLICPWRG
ncbi:MAG: phosphoribosyltransferase-like protein [Janthinobacterium lividum]